MKALANGVILILILIILGILLLPIWLISIISRGKIRVKDTTDKIGNKIANKFMFDI